MVVYAFRNLISNFRHHFRFSKEEIEACVISVLVMAFIVSFDKWGNGDAFDFGIGLGNFIGSIIIMGIVLGTQLTVTKIVSLNYGYRAEFKMWWYGLIIGLALCFLSGSLTKGMENVTIIWFLAPGGILFHHSAIHRLGQFRYGVNVKETGLTIIWGSFSTMVLAFLFKIMTYFFPENMFFYNAMMISVWFSFFSMLPFPPLNGSRVFYYSRLAYAFVFGIFLACPFLLKTDINIFLIILIALVMGILIWFLDLMKVEMD